MPGVGAACRLSQSLARCPVWSWGLEGELGSPLLDCWGLSPPPSLASLPGLGPKVSAPAGPARADGTEQQVWGFCALGSPSFVLASGWSL